MRAGTKRPREENRGERVPGGGIGTRRGGRFEFEILASVFMGKIVALCLSPPCLSVRVDGCLWPGGFAGFFWCFSFRIC